MDFSKDFEGFINHSMCVFTLYCKKDFWDYSDALRHMEMVHNITGVSNPNPDPLWPERQEHYCPFCDPVIMLNSLHCVLQLNCCRKKHYQTSSTCLQLVLDPGVTFTPLRTPPSIPSHGRDATLLQPSTPPTLQTMFPSEWFRKYI